jgi:hypothetical protein
MTISIYEELTNPTRQNLWNVRLMSRFSLITKGSLLAILLGHSKQDGVT